MKFRTIRRLAERAKEITERNEFQEENQVERENFHWIVNPLLANVRLAGAEIIVQQEAESKISGITEFDLAVQTMIHLAAYESKEVWLGNDSVLTEIQDNITSGSTDAVSEQFKAAIETGQIHLNNELVAKVCASQAEKLKTNAQNLYVTRDGKQLYLPASYMGNPEESPFKDTGRSEINTKAKQTIVNPEIGEQGLVVTEKHTGRKITFQKVSHDVSEMYGKGFHYIHEGRADELSAFGAYLEEDEFPFAWVSYSPTDRAYKQEMLEHLGLEPHTVLELTRAWNSSWSPRNTMSTLFGYAHRTLQREWEKKVDEGKVDKLLSGIISAINGNLGFNGSTFSGANLKVVGLKPANFTYLKHEDGSMDYMPRRAIMKALGLQSTVDLVGNPQYATNQFPLIPTNEMVVAFDKLKQEEISKKPIYRIPDDAYTSGS